MGNARFHEHLAMTALRESGIAAGPWDNPWVETSTLDDRRALHLVNHVYNDESTMTRMPLTQALTGTVRLCNLCVYRSQDDTLEPWRMLVVDLASAASYLRSVHELAQLSPGAATPQQIVKIAELFSDLYRGPLDHPVDDLSGEYNRCRRNQHYAAGANPEVVAPWQVVFDLLEQAHRGYETVRRARHGQALSTNQSADVWFLATPGSSSLVSLRSDLIADWCAVVEREPIAHVDGLVLIQAPAVKGRVLGAHQIDPVDAPVQALTAAMTLWHKDPDRTAESFTALIHATNAACAA